MATSVTGSRYSLRGDDDRGQLEESYLRFRQRHFSQEGRQEREERKARLPEYDRELANTFQRSFHRQTELMYKPESVAPMAPTASQWDVFPTVEDLDGCYTVEKQFEIAIDPHSDIPDMAEWMGLYQGEDGVFTLNQGLHHVPLTGKSPASKVSRIKDGVKMILVYRNSRKPEQGFGFKFTTMDSGVYVTHVEADGPAVRAGLRYGGKYCSLIG